MAFAAFHGSPDEQPPDIKKQPISVVFLIRYLSARRNPSALILRYRGIIFGWSAQGSQSRHRQARDQQDRSETARDIDESAEFVHVFPP
jgi:hypothetical protein